MPRTDPWRRNGGGGRGDEVGEAGVAAGGVVAHRQSRRRRKESDMAKDREGCRAGRRGILRAAGLAAAGMGMPAAFACAMGAQEQRSGGGLPPGGGGGSPPPGGGEGEPAPDPGIRKKGRPQQPGAWPL